MTPRPDDMDAASAAVATTTQAGWQGADGCPARAGRRAPLGPGPLETGSCRPLWNVGGWLMNREIHDLLDYSRPVACTTVVAIGLLHAKGLVCRRAHRAPALPSLPGWHYHAARSQAGGIGALIATRTPIPLTPARRR
jgi:hypothetical protein